MLLVIGGALLLEEWQERSGARPGASGRVIAGGDGCSVRAVIDGDTVEARCPRHERLKVRVVGLDAPEIFSPKCASELLRGMEAKRALARMLEEARAVRFDFQGRDDYDRELARLTVDEADLAERMIAAGHGRRYDAGRREGWCG